MFTRFQEFQRRYMEEAGGEGGEAGGGSGGEGGGGGEFNWREHIPEQYRNEAMFSEDQVKDFPSLIDQFANSQRLIGESIRIPGENADEDSINRFNEKLTGVKGVTRIPGMDAPEEEVNAFYEKLGVPESADKYEVYTPTEEDIPDGIEMDNSLNEDFTKTAHALKLTPAQVKGLSEWYTKSSLEKAIAKDGERKAMVDELKGEYGQDFDARMNLAKNVIEKFGTKYAVQDLKDGLGNHPGLAMMLADIGLATTEDGLMRRAPDGGEITKSATEVQMEIDELMSDPAYANSKHDNHKVVVKKVEQLFEQQELLKQRASA